MSTSTRQRLIDTAFNLFAHHGFHTVGLDRILHDVGVTKTTFYNHFESKDDLAIQVLRRRAAWEHQSFADALHHAGGPDPAHQLHALFDVLETWFQDDAYRRCIFIAAVVEYPSPDHPIHQIALDHRHDLERSLQHLAHKAGAADPADLAAQLTLLIEGASIYRHYEDNARGLALARQLAHQRLEHHLPHPAPTT